MKLSRCTALSFALAAALSGCANVTQRIPTLGLPGMPGTGPTAADVHNSLAIWADGFATLVTAASDRIRAETTQREVRRHTLLWQLRMIPLARRTAFREDVQEGYVAVLAAATAQHEYLTSGEGRQLFGEQQAIAVEVAAQLERDAVEVGRSFLDDNQVQRLQGQVDELVAKHPIRGVFAADALVQGFAASRVGGMFSWVVDLPMVPFRALSGVSDTAVAVQSFNETADEFNQTLNDLPHLTRWELELLLYDAEELESVERALRAAESFAEGADSIARSTERLPEELALRLEEARGTIEALDAALLRAEKLSGPLQHVADRIGEASTQWTALLGEMQADDEPDDGRPFDVREYEATAVRIADASRELRALVGELRALDAAALLNAAAWRAGVLIVVFFAALAGYRALASRLGRGRGEG